MISSPNSKKEFGFSNDIKSDLYTLYNLSCVQKIEPKIMNFVLFLTIEIINRYHVTNEELASIHENYITQNATHKKIQNTKQKASKEKEDINKELFLKAVSQTYTGTSEEKKEAIAKEVVKFLTETTDKLRNNPRLGAIINDMEEKLKDVVKKDNKFLENFWNDLIPTKKQ